MKGWHALMPVLCNKEGRQNEPALCIFGVMIINTLG